MAGGKFAEEVCCFVCMDEGKATRAKRVYEGIEDDHYRCDEGHEFGIDWSRGEPTEPQWPPPADIAAMLKG